MEATVWITLFIFAAIQGGYGLGLDELSGHKIKDIDDAINAIDTTISVVGDARSLMAHSRLTAQLSMDKLYESTSDVILTTVNTAETDISDLKNQALEEEANITECLTREGEIKEMYNDAQNELLAHLLYYSKFSTEDFLSSYENTTTYFDNYYKTLPNIEDCDSHDCLNDVSAALINQITEINGQLQTIAVAFDTSQSHIYQNFDYTVNHDTDVKLANLRTLTTTIIDCIAGKLKL